MPFPICSTLANSDIGVVAMDLGMDDALFDTLLMRDTLYIYLGGVFILVCIWFYTRSVLMTVFTLVAIIYSLAIAVFVYMVVLGMEFFPFMNVLAVLVNVGKLVRVTMLMSEHVLNSSRLCAQASAPTMCSST